MAGSLGEMELKVEQGVELGIHENGTGLKNPSQSRSDFDFTREESFQENEMINEREKELMVFECPVLPCWDETDDGIPPFCRAEDPSWWMVFNPKNRYTSDNLVCIMFGNIGFHYFDRERKTWMGIAMWSTLLGIAFTIAGCFAYSTQASIVKDTYWIHIAATNTTSGEDFLLHLGLRSLVYTASPCTPFGCSESNFVFSESTGRYPNEFVESGLGKCREFAGEAAFGALATCATLLFALSGTMSRMRFSSDANVQKALGMFTDLVCATLPQCITMWEFGKTCVWTIDTEFRGEIEATVHFGPGYWCYVVCLFGAMMRALFHWLTPVPGMGSGCRPEIPQSLVEILDTDGDGQVSWKELKTGYARLVGLRQEKAALEQAKKEESWAFAAEHGKTMVRQNMDPSLKAAHDREARQAARLEKGNRVERLRARGGGREISRGAKQGVLKKQPSSSSSSSSRSVVGGSGCGGASRRSEGGGGLRGRTPERGNRKGVSWQGEVLEPHSHQDAEGRGHRSRSRGASTWWRDSSNYMYDAEDDDAAARASELPEWTHSPYSSSGLSEAAPSSSEAEQAQGADFRGSTDV